MTDTASHPTIADDIETGVDTPSERLTRQADALLAEGPTLAPRPLRQALPEDAVRVRDWGRDRASRLRRTVQDEPVKASLYALGLGVLIGLLAAR